MHALVVLVTIALLGVAALVVVRRIRQGIIDRLRQWWPEIRATLQALRSGSKLTLLVGGSLATEVLFAIALGLFAQAFGYDIGLADLLLINISVSLLASFVPVPGGIGVAEFGLTVGLVSAGVPDEVALVVAVLYRTATFYVPPWGFFAMRWLKPHRPALTGPELGRRAGKYHHAVERRVTRRHFVGTVATVLGALGLSESALAARLRAPHAARLRRTQRWTAIPR